MPTRPDANKLLSNGPFTLTAWGHSQFATLSKNEQYWDHTNVKLNKVNLLMPVAGADAEQPCTRPQRLDRMPLLSSEYPNYQSSSELVTRNELSSSYLMFEVTNPALTSAKIRKALTYAIDAERYGETAYGATAAKAATGFVPIGVSDGQGGDFRTTNGDLINRAANQAQAEDLAPRRSERSGLVTTPAPDGAVR